MTPREVRVVVVGSAVLVLAGGMRYAQALEQRIADTRHRLEQAVLVAERAWAVAAEGDSLAVEAELVRARVADLAALFLARGDDGDPRSVLASLVQGAAVSHGLTLESAAPEPDSATDAVEWPAVRVRTLGSTRATAGFINAVESLPQLISMETLSVTADEYAGGVRLDAVVRGLALVSP